MLRRFDHVWKVFTFCLIRTTCHFIRKYSRWSTIPKYVIISIDRPGSSVFLIFARLRFAYFFGGCGCLAWSWNRLKVKGDTRQLLRNQKKIGYHFRVVFMFMLLCHWLQNLALNAFMKYPIWVKLAQGVGDHNTWNGQRNVCAWYYGCCDSVADVSMTANLRGQSTALASSGDACGHRHSSTIGTGTNIATSSNISGSCLYRKLFPFSFFASWQILFY